MKKLFLLFFLISVCTCYSQSLDFLPQGLGIEFGLGYNQLKHQEIPSAPLYSSESLLRNGFKLTPTFRLSWRKGIFYNFSLRPFVGYSIIGGKSNPKANGYEDEYLFKTLELGLFASYRLNNVSLSIGSKYNRFLNVTGKFFGSPVDPAGTNRVWVEKDMSPLFKKGSINLGGGLSYAYSHFIFAAEAWFSLSNLTNKDFENFVNVSSKRFQILVGYEL